MTVAVIGRILSSPDSLSLRAVRRTSVLSRWWSEELDSVRQERARSNAGLFSTTVDLATVLSFANMGVGVDVDVAMTSYLPDRRRV